MVMFSGLLGLMKSEGIRAVCVSLCGLCPQLVWREVIKRKGKEARAAFTRRE